MSSAFRSNSKNRGVGADRSSLSFTLETLNHFLRTLTLEYFTNTHTRSHTMTDFFFLVVFLKRQPGPFWRWDSSCDEYHHSEIYKYNHGPQQNPDSQQPHQNCDRRKARTFAFLHRRWRGTVSSTLQTMALWAAQMSFSLAAQTVSQYLAAAQSLSSELGYGSPLKDFLELKKVVLGLLRLKGSSTSHLISLSLSPWTRAFVGPSSHVPFRPAASLRTGSDIHAQQIPSSSLCIVMGVQNDVRHFNIFIKFSKTDQLVKGHTVTVGRSYS